jgi:hypothetical protein
MLNKTLKRLIRSFGPMGLAVFCVTTASASSLCTTMTAADFAALGAGGCQFNNTTFYSFSYSYTPGALSAPVPAAAVTVSFSSVGGDPLEPIITFSANWDSTQEDISDIRIHYSASTFASPATNGMTPSIVAAQMALSGNFGFNNTTDPLGSFVSGAETVRLDAPGVGSTALDANIQPDSGTSYGLMSASSGNVSFAGQTQISISKDIQLFAGDNPDDADLLQFQDGLTETVSPEPGTWLITLGGMAAGLANLLLRRAKGNA